jgi:hypothetical protein
VTAFEDRRRDRTGWLTTPLVTLVLAPALAISIGILVAESSTAYPGICQAAAATNGCEETVSSMLVLHARIFAAGWLLLWALPWWRGLRAIRIGAAVALGAVLLAAPLRLVDWGGIDLDLRDRSTRYAVVIVLLIGLPLVGFVWSALTGHRWVAAAFVVLALVMGMPVYALARVAYHTNLEQDSSPPGGGAGSVCVMHSGSHDVCPGG